MTSDPKPIAEGWPEPRQFRRSIRLQISLLISGLILVLMLATGYVVTAKFVDTATRDVVDKLVVQARSFSGTAGKHIISAAGPDALMLNNICKKLARDNTDVYWAAIADNKDAFIAHTDIKQVIASGRMAALQSTDYADLLREGESVWERSDTIFVSIPVTENGIDLGRLGVAASKRQIYAARQASIVTVASVTLVMLVLGLIVTMFGLQRGLKPIGTITDALKGLDYANLSVNIPLKTRNEFGYLAETLRVMGAKLNQAQRERIESERMARDLEIAREIQARILPKAYPISPSFQCSGVYRSALEVGGDYYDFIEIDSSRLAFLVADVSGKSLPGMLVMLLTRDIVRHWARQLAEPARILSAANRELRDNIKPGMFVTMFVGVLDHRRGHFSFASAGHNPLIYVPAASGKADLIKTHGFPLGMMPVAQFDKRIETGTLDIQPGDWLVQYTDGINEAQNANREEYGMNRFVESVERTAVGSPQQLVETVLAHQTSFVGQAPQYDDITLVALKWMGVTADNLTRTREAAGIAQNA